MIELIVDVLLLKITQANYKENYKLDLSFNDGFTGIVDLKNKIFTDHRPIFKALQNVEYFKKFAQNRWTIEWNNGVDLAPEFLRELAQKQNQNYVSKYLILSLK